MNESLQTKYAAKSICFGCGPANTKGLQIQSFVDGDRVICRWKPQPHHQAFPNVLNGGIVGALLDCHSNWTAAWAIMNHQGASEPPCTVTAEYKVQLKRPTPTNEEEIFLEAKVLDSDKKKAKVYAELKVKDEVCATCEGFFVAVKPDHPAYHRW